jgi:hypothetical protein
MMNAVTNWLDRFLGRGEAAITIPVFDGALKPNRLLDEAAVAAELPEAEDLATDGMTLFVADGRRILSLSGGQTQEVARFDKRITALACMPGGGFAVALDGREVVLEGGSAGVRRWTKAGDKLFRAVNALSVRRNGAILVSDGSAANSYDRWCYDLMSRGRTGRLVECNPQDGSAREVASDLAYTFGICDVGNEIWAAESWRHRIISYRPDGSRDVVLDELPGYPARITQAADGGFWLAVFAGRTQLVEFVLREPAYCKRMMAEIDPRYWIAPALSSGHSFLEPLQGAGVKMRGVLKPWAPPRSYGLVVKLSAEGAVERSYHSRLDGHRHGVVALAECNGSLFVLSKGSGCILEIPTTQERQ